MEEARFINYKGMEIFRLHIPDGVDYAGMVKILDEAKNLIHGRPEESVNGLTIIGNIHFTPEMTKFFEEYVKSNKPYIKESAVIGITGLKKVLYNAFMILSHRQVKICETEEEGKEFLFNAAQ